MLKRMENTELQNVNEKLIRDCRKSKQQLQEKIINRQTFREPKCVIFPLIEDELLTYIRTSQNDSCMILCEMLKRKSQ